jgi:hypothetical protein
VRHGYAAIDTQTLDLEEHRIVSRIGRVTPEYASGRDHPHRHAATLHRVNLHG